MLRELEALSQADFRRILAAIHTLGMEPRPMGAAHLEADIFRLRVGRFRVIYQVNDNDRIVDVGGIRRRTERTYRRVRDLFSD